MAVEDDALFRRDVTRSMLATLSTYECHRVLDHLVETSQLGAIESAASHFTVDLDEVAPEVFRDALVRMGIYANATPPTWPEFRETGG